MQEQTFRTASSLPSLGYGYDSALSLGAFSKRPTPSPQAFLLGTLKSQAAMHSEVASKG